MGLKPGSKERITFFLLLLTVTINVGTDIYLPCLESITTHFGISHTLFEWSIITFFPGVAIGYFLLSFCSQNIDKRSLVFLGLVLYAIGTLFCMVPTNFSYFMIGRFLQGISNALCFGMVIPIFNLYFTPQEVVRRFSWAAVMWCVSPILSPLIGTLIDLTCGWYMNFVLLLVLTLVTIWLLFICLPSPAPSNRLSPYSLLKTSKSISKLLRHPQFLRYSFLNGATIGGWICFIVATPYIFLKWFGSSQIIYSIYLGINVVGYAAGTLFVNRTIKKWPPYRLLVLGGWICCLSGLYTIASISILPVTDWDFCLAITLFYAGAALVFPISSVRGVNLFPKQQNMASALLNFMRIFISSLLITILTLMHDGTPWPLAYITLFCGVLTLGLTLRLRI